MNIQDLIDKLLEIKQENHNLELIADVKLKVLKGGDSKFLDKDYLYIKVGE